MPEDNRDLNTFYRAVINAMWIRILNANRMPSDEGKIHALQEIVDYYQKNGLPDARSINE